VTNCPAFKKPYIIQVFIQFLCENKDEQLQKALAEFNEGETIGFHRHLTQLPLLPAYAYTAKKKYKDNHYNMPSSTSKAPVEDKLYM
jgi:hypothetical protein